MVTLSSMRHGVSTAEMAEVCRQLVRWPGFARLQIATRLADGRLEPVGEVRSLHLMWQFHLLHPELQEKIREDAIRDLSYGVSRWVWAGLEADRREQTAQLIRAGMERSRRLYVRSAVHIG